jgi:hypothetical protein
MIRGGEEDPFDDEDDEEAVGVAFGAGAIGPITGAGVVFLLLASLINF